MVKNIYKYSESEQCVEIAWNTHWGHDPVLQPFSFNSILVQPVKYIGSN